MAPVLQICRKVKSINVPVTRMNKTCLDKMTKLKAPSAKQKDMTKTKINYYKTNKQTF